MLYLVRGELKEKQHIKRVIFFMQSNKLFIQFCMNVHHCKHRYKNWDVVAWGQCLSKFSYDTENNIFH